MAKHIRSIVPRLFEAKEIKDTEKPKTHGTNTSKDLNIDLSDYDTQDDGGVRVSTKGVTDLHKGKVKDYPLDTASFNVPTKYTPDERHGLTKPKDKTANDGWNQRETSREKRMGSSALVQNVINRRQAGSDSRQTTEEVEQIDENDLIKAQRRHDRTKKALDDAEAFYNKTGGTGGKGSNYSTIGTMSAAQKSKHLGPYIERHHKAKQALAKLKPTSESVVNEVFGGKTRREAEKEIRARGMTPRKASDVLGDPRDIKIPIDKTEKPEPKEPSTSTPATPANLPKPPEANTSSANTEPKGYTKKGIVSGIAKGFISSFKEATNVSECGMEGESGGKCSGSKEYESGGKCNNTREGESCPSHGMSACPPKDMPKKGQKLLTDKKKKLDEKHLTPAELKKREEIAKAIHRKQPGMEMGKKMRIATAQAKKVAEDVETESLVEKVRRIAKKNKKEDQSYTTDGPTSHTQSVTGHGGWLEQ